MGREFGHGDKYHHSYFGRSHHCGCWIRILSRVVLELLAWFGNAKTIRCEDGRQNLVLVLELELQRLNSRL